MSWEDGSLESLRGFLTGPPEGGEEDHAFARRAVEQGYLTRDQVEECLSLQPGRPLLDTLREKRLLSESRIQIILTLLKPHPGNPRAPGEGVPSGPSSDTRLSIPDPDSGPGAGRRLGRYELLDVVGEGGMGIVFRAKDPELGRDVALKVLKPPLSFSSQQMERFRREQRTAAKLTHPGIVAIYDLGRENDVLYYTMELVRGTALSASLGLPAAVGVLAKVARAVQFAHDHGVIHRDLKPANIMVDSRGEPRVLDFGLSRDVDVPSELTRTGSPFGTLDYMSPEQAEGRVDAVGVATDIYALGAILYQLLAGRPPFTGSSAREIVSRILSKDPEPPPGPAELSSIALQALEKEPTRRYLSAGAFAEDLDRYLAGKAVEARPPSLRARLWRKAGFQRATLVPALAVVALGLAGLGWWASGAASGAGRVACVVELLGSVRAITQGATGPVSLHQWLLSNQGLSTGASPSRAVLRYLDGTILRVSPEAILQSLSENQASGSGKRGTRKAGFLVKGTVDAEVVRQVPEFPMILSTPHGEIRTAGARMRLVVEPSQTTLEVTEGEAEASRSSEGGAVTVSAGSYAVLGARTPLVAKPTISGLMGYWNFDEGTGSLASDSAPGKNHATLSNGAAWTEGIRGGAVSLAGDHGAVKIPAAPALTDLGPLTVAAWIKPTWLAYGRIVARENVGPGRWRFFVGDNTLAFAKDFSLQEVRRETVPNLLPLGTWHHVAATWDGTPEAAHVHLYVDGAEPEYSVTRDGAGDKCPDGLLPLLIGNNGDLGHGFIGAIDEVRIYQRVLTPAEIRALVDLRPK